MFLENSFDNYKSKESIELQHFSLKRLREAKDDARIMRVLRFVCLPRSTLETFVVSTESEPFLGF